MTGARATARIDGLVNNAGGQYRAPMKTFRPRLQAVVRSQPDWRVIFMREVV